MYGALPQLYLLDFKEQKGGEGKGLKVTMWGASRKREGSLFMGVADPCRHHGKALNIYIDYLIFFSSRQHVK